MKKVLTGLDILQTHPIARWRGPRVGVLAHQASVDSRLGFIMDILLHRQIQVTTLFAPEHGLWGTAQDQVPIEGADPLQPTSIASATRHVMKRHGTHSNIPIFSLYGDRRAPSEEQLREVDILICDLQDVGARYYTFIWTMALAMQACAKFGKKFVVLDRPNPLGGVVSEGPLLDLNFASFVGLYPVPVRHGMTIGELALWLNDRFDLKADVEVIAMHGWKRNLWFDETGLPWVAPSPNMPTLETATVYPGGCLLEGTNLSEGRGTTLPFEMTGAPFIDGEKLAAAMNAMKLAGVFFRACRFEPTFHKFQGQLCGGVQVHVTDRDRFRSFLTYLLLIQKTRDLFPGFAWRDPPYEYETVKWPFDILCGKDDIRQVIENNGQLSPLRNRWLEDAARFADDRREFLLYN